MDETLIGIFMVLVLKGAFEYPIGMTWLDSTISLFLVLVKFHLTVVTMFKVVLFIFLFDLL